MSRITFTALLICLGISASFAQDSAKIKPPVKTNPKYTYKHHSYHYYAAKADSVAKSPVGSTLVRTDTVIPPPVLTDKSLNGQYQYLLTRVYHYQQPLISALWKNASDTLTANRGKLNAALKKLKVQNQTVDSLKTQLNNNDQQLSATNERIGGIDLFGIILSKATYNLVMWGLVAIFGIIAIVVVARSGSFRRETRYRRQLYNELEEEFKTYKTKANEKEKKLARELQTERNKLDELQGRG